jgi:nucleobase:cation symporter-1, NCS1 family
VMVVGTVIGWGLVVNTSASWLKWQGYLLGPIGLGGKSGTWAFANLGVVIALAVALAAWLLLGRRPIRAQEGTGRASRPSRASRKLRA